MTSNFTPILTTHLFISDRYTDKDLGDLNSRLVHSGITVREYKPQDSLLSINPKHPRVYVSIGSEVDEFTTLNALPLHERNRWLHFSSPTAIQPSHLFYCWLYRTDPLSEKRLIPNNRFSSDTPLVSVFTASYRSKGKIKRPFQSLLNQTYSNWEWIIVDDSGDQDETYTQDLLPLNDPRIRRYRQDARNGYIGAIKRYAAGLCTGEILVEVDHDDELTPDCLEKIVQAFKKYPDCGFAYGDNAEVYEGNHNAHWYGWNCGFGYSMYYRVWVHEMNRWQNVMKQTTINESTIRHLVGLPNHPRAWTRDCYHLVGGHREELLVADDYDLLVRTFLCTKFVAIPDLLYIQYRNENGNNSTFQRNRQIQTLVKAVNTYYNNSIYSRLSELGLPKNLPYNRIWETTADDPARVSGHKIAEIPDKVSLIFPLPFHTSINDAPLLKALEDGIETNFQDVEIVVVGDIPLEIELYAARAPMGAIRWWPMKKDDSLETCIEYAKLCASCKEKIVIFPPYSNKS